MFYVGLDVHRRRTQVAVLDENGHEVFNRNVPNDRAKLSEVLVGCGPGTPVVFEATPPARLPATASGRGEPFVGVMQGEANKICILLMGFCGPRIGETFGLRVEDVILAAALLDTTTAPTKAAETGNRRPVRSRG